MRMPHTLLLLALACTSFLARASGMGDWGTRLVPVLQNSRGWTGHAQITGVRWTARSGHSKTVVGARPVNLFDGAPLVAPPGEWVELTLLLDGPMTLSGQTASGAAFDWALDVPEFNVVLDQPADSDGTDLLRVHLTLPDGALPARVRPGQAGHDALVLALQDGASASGE